MGYLSCVTQQPCGLVPEQHSVCETHREDYEKPWTGPQGLSWLLVLSIGGLLFFGVLCLCSESVACWLEIKHSSSRSKEVPGSRCLDRRKRNARAVGKSLEALVPICGLTTALQIPWVDSVSFLFIPLSLAKANQVRGQYAATQTSRNACSAPPGEES